MFTSKVTVRCTTYTRSDMSRSHPIKDINTEESVTPVRQTLKQQREREREGEGDKCIDAVAFFL